MLGGKCFVDKQQSTEDAQNGGRNVCKRIWKQILWDLKRHYPHKLYSFEYDATMKKLSPTKLTTLGEVFCEKKNSSDDEFSQKQLPSSENAKLKKHAR